MYKRTYHLLCDFKLGEYTLLTNEVYPHTKGFVVLTAVVNEELYPKIYNSLLLHYF